MILVAIIPALVAIVIFIATPHVTHERNPAYTAGWLRWEAVARGTVLIFLDEAP